MVLKRMFCISYSSNLLQAKRTLIYWLIVLIIGDITSGHIPQPGKCPTRKPINSVNTQKMVGVWYELESSPSLAEWPYKCMEFKVQPFYEKKSKVTVTVIHRYTDKLENHLISLAIPKASDVQDGKFIAKNVTTDGIHVKTNITVQILATQPNWAIAWSCVQYRGLYTEMLWVFSRRRQAAEGDWEKIAEAKTKLNIEGYRMLETVQSACGQEDQQEEDEG